MRVFTVLAPQGPEPPFHTSQGYPRLCLFYRVLRGFELVIPGLGGVIPLFLARKGGLKGAIP